MYNRMQSWAKSVTTNPKRLFQIAKSGLKYEGQNITTYYDGSNKGHLPYRDQTLHKIRIREATVYVRQLNKQCEQVLKRDIIIVQIDKIDLTEWRFILTSVVHNTLEHNRKTEYTTNKKVVDINGHFSCTKTYNRIHQLNGRYPGCNIHNAIGQQLLCQQPIISHTPELNSKYK